MTKLVGDLDRIARLAVGSILPALVSVGRQPSRGWVSLAPLLTGLLGWCSLYTAPGFNTGASSGKPT
ncbi:MAG TPA: DUF2892 domain-containing protein [Candidatus Competibacter sp.]|nr:DUF2892 domain-containing protein [Candidatus Competibacteraceae bacterium]HRE55911.1 DUF2892 domain-containing protein [Candidatus Competibacter sp.]HUM96149.1 DUF2892 domain-containing protein [Candidatus Competibacter sp.]